MPPGHVSGAEAAAMAQQPAVGTVVQPAAVTVVQPTAVQQPVGQVVYQQQPQVVLRHDREWEHNGQPFSLGLHLYPLLLR